MKTNRHSVLPHASLSVCAAVALLSGCAAVGPDYTPPSLPVPGEFSSLDGASPLATSGGAALDARELAAWWTTFGDATLTSLTQRALAANLDVRLATERVREARALRGAADADRFPTVDANGNATRRQFSSTTGNPGPTESNMFRAGLDASWEIDVFGGVRRGVQASQADLEAEEAGQRAVLVSVAGEVARNYVEVRAFQQRRLVIERGVNAQARTVDLVRSRLNAGVGSQLELAQAEAQLASRRAQVPALAISEREASHRLAVLLGSVPSALREELATPGAIPAMTGAVRAGLPSDLLLRRPDVQAAERRVAAASARIGVATADLFPRFSLTGSFGLESEELDQFADASSRSWGIGPTVRWNLFDAGRIRRQIDAAGSREKQALIAYEQTVLTALEDVENALTQATQQQARAAALRDAVAASTRAATLADDRYRAGVSEFLNVLDAQRSQYDTEDLLVESEAGVARATIALYKALGGGWDAAGSTP